MFRTASLSVIAALKNGEVEYAHRGDLQNENVPVSEIADKLIAKIKVR